MQASQDNLRFPITGTGSSSGFRKPFTLTGIPAINKFISRPSEMDFLERELFPLGSVRRRKKILVIHGLGGIGKTQLAIEFARNHREKFSSIFWINGKSHDSLIESFNQILQKISKARDSVFDDSQLLSVENIREEVLHWLELQGNDKWLLIFDNCDSDKDDPGGYELSNYLPASDCGSIIITTRRSHLAVLGTADLAVGKMNIQQSLNVLERNLGQGFSDDDESKLSRSCTY
jgi:Cdc6-like AAA superfamily ATPase